MKEIEKKTLKNKKIINKCFKIPRLSKKNTTVRKQGGNEDEYTYYVKDDTCRNLKNQSDSSAKLKNMVNGSEQSKMVLCGGTQRPFFFSFCVGLEVGVIPSGLGVMGWLRRCSLSHVMA